MSADLKHWLINATVFKERIEETHYFSDPKRNIRRQEAKSTWHIEQLLGRGASGEVKLQRNKENGEVRAVKRIATPEKILSTSEWEKELEALVEFSKPKFRDEAVFIEFYGWFRDGPDMFLAMEFVELGDLETNVRARSGKVSESEARDIAHQILFGLEIMHAEKFTHRDLKPQNVLVVSASPKWWIKLADFGLSKKLTEATDHTRCGTPSYMAPEILNLYVVKNPGSGYTNAVDIWAVGCIIYRLVVGVVPFPPGYSLMEFCAYPSDGSKSRFPRGHLLDIKTTTEFDLFLRQLIVLSPDDRLSASLALLHLWFESNLIVEGNSSSEIPNSSAVGAAFSDLTISQIGYSTVSHAGLRSEMDAPLKPTFNKIQNSPGSSSVKNQSLNIPSETGNIQSSLTAQNTKRKPTAPELLLLEQSDPLGGVQKLHSKETSSNSRGKLREETNNNSSAIWQYANNHKAGDAWMGYEHNLSEHSLGGGTDPFANPFASDSTSLGNTVHQQVSYPSVNIPEASSSWDVNKGMTPLMIAVLGRDSSIILEEIGKGADMEAYDSKGWTALHTACWVPGGFYNVELLLRNGANPDAVEQRLQHRTPMMIALDANNDLSVSVLIEMGANLNATDLDGSMILHLATKKGHYEIVEELLKEGADVKARDGDGFTPLDLARKSRLRGPKIVAEIESHIMRERQRIVEANRRHLDELRLQDAAEKYRRQLQLNRLATERQISAPQRTTERTRQPSPPRRKKLSSWFK